MREIVFDTETTGLSPDKGDRVVEIGCLELVNRLPSGETFHVYLNPERDMSAAAEAIHGLSSAFLADKPLFADVADAFLAFIGDAPLIAHNASFDMGFINAELIACGRDDLRDHKIIDTLALARQKFPGAPASLDALCRRFGVDNTGRTLHGALLDSELLAEVYLELSGGRQPDLVFANKPAAPTASSSEGQVKAATPEAPAPVPRTRQKRPNELPPRVTSAERAAHLEFLQDLPHRAVWLAEGDG